MKTTIAQVDGIGLGVLLVLSAAVYFFGARPLLSARADAARQAETVATRQQEVDDTSRKLESTSGRLRQVSRELSDDAIALQSASQTNTRVAELTKRATEDRLEINEIKPGTPEPGPRFVRVPIRITGSGSFLACAGFMHHLREQFRDMGLAAFDLSGDASSSPDAVRFTFDLTWYTAPAVQASAESTPPG